MIETNTLQSGRLPSESTLHFKMRNMKNIVNKATIMKLRFMILSVIALQLPMACTDLEEEVFSEVTESSFVPAESDIIAVMASAYTPLRFVMGWQGYFDVQEEPADMFVTPTRPNGWDDGGTYKRMHFHEWTETQWQPRNTWITCFNGINSTNRVILQIESGQLPVSEEQSSAIIAEMRALRALYYSMLVDTHGNVPIIASYSDELPVQSSRAEVYNFIVSELNEVIPNLQETVDQSTYGRMTKWAAYHVLARVYLNAEVYSGTQQWANVISTCDEIINRNLKITFEGSTRANLINEEITEKLKNAGLIRLSFGLESADEAIRKTMNKKVPLKYYTRANKILDENGIECLNSVMLGLPGETRKTIYSTLDFLQNDKHIKQANFAIAIPYPGTKFHDFAINEEHGMKIIDEDFSKYRRYGNAVTNVGDLSAQDLIDLQNEGFVRIYSAPWRWKPMFAKHGIIGGLLTLMRVFKLIIKKHILTQTPFRIHPGVP